jgi:hypothetical protein
MKPLSEQEVAANQGYTHRARINAADLTVTATATSQTFDLGPIPLGAQVQVKIDLKVPFKDVSDSAFNDCAITIGDTSTANVFLTTTQLNENGTEVLFKEGSLSAPYTSALTIRVTWGSMTAKALNDLDVGLLYIFVKLCNIRAADSFAVGVSTK